jgi:hypothetical protein
MHFVLFTLSPPLRPSKKRSNSTLTSAIGAPLKAGNPPPLSSQSHGQFSAPGPSTYIIAFHLLTPTQSTDLGRPRSLVHSMNPDSTSHHMHTSPHLPASPAALARPHNPSSSHAAHNALRPPLFTNLSTCQKGRCSRSDKGGPCREGEG